MRVLSKIIYYLIWAIFIFLLFEIALIFGFNLIPNLQTDIIQDGLIAFFGAFFAFVFVQFASWIRIKRKENVNHFNGLVKIERLLNKVITRLEENILIFQRHKDVLKSMKLLA